MVIVPSSSLTFSEDAQYIELYIEEETKYIDKLIGSSICLNESDILEKLVENIGKLVENIIRVIRDFFNKAIEFFIGIIEKVINYFKDKKNIENLDKIGDNVVICKTRTYFEPDKINFAQNSSNLANNIYTYITSANVDAIEPMSENSLCEYISGIKCTDIKDMKEKLREKLSGQPIEITKANLKANLPRFESIVFEDKIPRNIKKMYSEEEQTLKKLVSDIKAKCREDESIKDTYKVWSNAISSISRITMCCYSIAFDIYKRMYKEYTNIFVKCSQILEPPERNEDMNDIYYNKSKFDAGEINLACVIGYSGSGKSTMTANIGNVEVIDLDNILMRAPYSTKGREMVEKTDAIKEFFIGPGEKYVNIAGNLIFIEEKGKMKFFKMMYRDLFEFIKSYAASHKDQKFLMDGVWTFMFSKPSEWDNYCVLIKGTSPLISAIRAGRRGKVTGEKMNTIDSIIYKQARIINNITINNKQQFKKWIEYYKPKADNVKDTPTGSSPVGSDTYTQEV